MQEDGPIVVGPGEVLRLEVGVCRRGVVFVGSAWPPAGDAAQGAAVGTLDTSGDGRDDGIG